MSTVFRFSVIGDLNVQTNINKNSRRASPLVKDCQMIFCGRMEVLASSLESVRAESNVCVLSCVSNFIAGCDGPTSITQRVEPTLQDFRSAILTACSANPHRDYMVSPPMYRTSPLWYREGLPEILTLFSGTMNQDKPQNMFLLPSFPTPDFDQDGVHLTPISGFEFILHLFDGSQHVLESQEATIEEVTSLNSEANRVLEDRVVALEQDHRRLHRVVDHKIAIDAELSDFAKNERFEEWFVLEGTDRIPDEVVGKPWQDQAIRDTQEVLKVLRLLFYLLTVFLVILGASLYTL